MLDVLTKGNLDYTNSNPQIFIYKGRSGTNPLQTLRETIPHAKMVYTAIYKLGENICKQYNKLIYKTNKGFIQLNRKTILLKMAKGMK